MGNSTHQSDHQTVTAMPNKSLSSEKALQSDSLMPEFNKEDINSPSYNTKHPREGQRHNLNDKAEPQDNNNNTNNQSNSPQSVADSKIVAVVQKLQQAEGIPKEPRPLNNSDSLEQKDYPHLQTDVSADKKYVPVQPAALPTEKLVTKASSEKPEETVVTVNIGRIEIRSASEGSGTRAPPLKKEFSPALSLADYLKQRAERKARAL
jgi:hypothetical protein